MTAGRAGLAALVTALLTVGIVTATTGAQSATGGRTLTFKEFGKAEVDGYDDVAPKTLNKDRLSPADRFTSAIQLRTLSGKPAGSVDLVCTATRPQHFPKVAVPCVGVAKVSDGTLAFAGIVNIDKNKQTLAVTGGTGAYEGARGTITSVGQGNNTDTVKLLP
jgi:hypothetical protein